MHFFLCGEWIAPAFWGVFYSCIVFGKLLLTFNPPEPAADCFSGLPVKTDSNAYCSLLTGGTILCCNAHSAVSITTDL